MFALWKRCRSAIRSITTAGFWAVAPESRYANGLPSTSRSRNGNWAWIASTSNPVAAVVVIGLGRRAGGLDLFDDRAVAVGLECRDELGPALLDDLAVVE